MIAGLVLAAGSSDRMGEANKLLVPIAGKAMINHVVDSLLASSLDDVWVVSGYQSAQLKAQLATAAGSFHWLENTDYTQGLSTSLRCGLQALPSVVDAVMVVQADMPGLTTAHLELLLSAYRQQCPGDVENEQSEKHSAQIVAPFFQGRRGNPVIFPRLFFDDMQGVSGDQGARDIVKLNSDTLIRVAMPDDAVLVDVDTVDQLHQVRAHLEKEDPEREQ